MLENVINKIEIKNFKKFQNLTINFNTDLNILVGDNESGKSTILQAIDLVSSGSKRKITDIGLDKLFNKQAVKNFLNLNDCERTIQNLPILEIDLYLTSTTKDCDLEGNNNINKEFDCGIRLVCEINYLYQNEVNKILKDKNNIIFPFDYYSIEFTTFAGVGFIPRSKKIFSLLINTNNINSKYSYEEFIKKIYQNSTEIEERLDFQSSYRKARENFSSQGLQKLNNKTTSKYIFSLKDASENSLEQDLVLKEDDIDLASRGEGKQVFIKIDFALNSLKKQTNILLIEEPENHLSHIYLQKIINLIKNNNKDCQIFITTHNNLICSRLSLKKVIILSQNNNAIKLESLDKEDADFFQKAPYLRLLEFCISSKIILVEGAAEYILFEKFYESHTKNKPEDDNIQICSIGGVSFKRYLSIAKLLECKVAVVTDNDHDYEKNISNKYKDFESCKNIKIFSNQEEKEYTFEVSLYNKNKNECNEIFKKNDENCLNYMLLNKAECAYKLLNTDKQLNIPEYLKEAIEWIKD